MTFKRFYFVSIGLSLVLVAVFVAFNVSMNEFGLFGAARGKRLRIWSMEKTSKYLLSFNYIPANFDALVVGPSLSDQLDTRKFRGHRVYNLSMVAGNVHELRLPLMNALERGNITHLIICLHPYLTRDNMLKDKRLTPYSYWSTLGSTFTFKFYADKLMLLGGGKNDNFAESYEGYCRPQQEVPSVEAAVSTFAAKLRQAKGQRFPVDPAAVDELRELLTLARKKNVRILAYYHPEPYAVFAAQETCYRQYQQLMNSLLSPDDVVLDFNTPAYAAFRKDLSNYIDHGHLSVKGAEFVVEELNRLLERDTPRLIQHHA